MPKLTFIEPASILRAPMKALDRLFQFRERKGFQRSREAHVRDFRWLLAKMAIVQLCASLLVFHFYPDIVRLAQDPLFRHTGSPYGSSGPCF